eukprot:9848482-Alexandrium_andersonii.AAC.1
MPECVASRRTPRCDRSGVLGVWSGPTKEQESAPNVLGLAEKCSKRFVACRKSAPKCPGGYYTFNRVPSEL